MVVAIRGRETWAPTGREQHIRRLLENDVLRKIFGPNRGKYQEKLTAIILIQSLVIHKLEFPSAY
jgi:hypothetical protein